MVKSGINRGIKQGMDGMGGLLFLPVDKAEGEEGNKTRLQLK